MGLLEKAASRSSALAARNEGLLAISQKKKPRMAIASLSTTFLRA